MRTLVTGLGGFTGKYLREELGRAGHEVAGLEADLTDASAVAAEIGRIQPEWVVHLAGIAFVGHGDQNDFYKVNLLGTRNLLSSLAGCARRPSCVLLASSSNVYGNSLEGVLSEESPEHPANDYAVSKMAMERMARLWHDRLPLVIARPFNYTGVGQSEAFLVPKIVAHFRARAAVIELGNLDVWRDLSDVRSVVRAYRRLLEECPAGQTVNVCSGRTYSLREILALMEGIAGYDIEVAVNAEYVRQSEVRRLCGDPSRLRRLIGDWHTPPLDETLRWMYSR
ncbi:GDP-mannose 4,6-dehydratase [Thiomonas sp. FB-6]|uniref:GDP-mannose 4,6-dehydratase n=1 Tax=Thiomonas sp. FB-6 TaxID=1158291 RepID=UPI00036FC858|nr:GDP-mannose 4,6-dehydratase [Thiomonas sp. FB-6]